eukprot:6529691-Karenia_brevis.AAC.1
MVCVVMRSSQHKPLASRNYGSNHMMVREYMLEKVVKMTHKLSSEPSAQAWTTSSKPCVPWSFPRPRMKLKSNSVSTVRRQVP